MPRRIKQQPLVILVIAVVFVGSLLMMFVKQPERVVVISEDGLLRIEGMMRETNRVLIEVIDGPSNQYAVSIDQGRKMEDVTITFFSNEVSDNGTSLLMFDRAKNQWTHQLFIYDDIREQYFVRLDDLSSTLLQIDQ